MFFKFHSEKIQRKTIQNFLLKSLATQMSSGVVIVAPTHWIPLIILNVIYMIIAFRILFSEIRTRKQPSVTFTTGQFKIWSIMCITSSFTQLFCALLTPFNVLCTFAEFLNWTSLVTTGLSMGFYQLWRLHYCFANSQIHSDKGYPKWLFHCMYIIGILVAIGNIVAMDMVQNYGLFNSKCGINDKFEYYAHPIDHANADSNSGLYPLITLLAFLAWDLFTLCLYIFKIRTFKMYKDKDPSVYKRIQSILQKIFILTTFYQIIGVCFVMMIGLLMIMSGVIGIDIYSILSQSIMGLMSLTMSISMYLMMDHNIKKYQQFLKIVRRLKLNYLCCGWRYFVLEQLHDLDENRQMVENEMNVSNADSQLETRNQSEMNHKIEMIETSLPTIIN